MQIVCINENKDSARHIKTKFNPRGNLSVMLLLRKTVPDLMIQHIRKQNGKDEMYCNVSD